MSSGLHKADLGILILTNPQDFHVFLVSEALSAKGVAHTLWFLTDFPSCQRGSIQLSEDQATWTFGSLEGTFRLDSKPAVVWVRRPGRPVLSSEVAPADREFAYRECSAFLSGAREFIGEDAFWINPPEGFAKANLKLAQLRAATRCGLKIPSTLMSNEPERIRQFVEMHRHAIYKSFFPFSWQLSDGIATVFCSPVSISDLDDDLALSSVPGIFQALVPKSYELRITAMGDHMVSARLESQSVVSARSDWRAAVERVPITPTELPESIVQACRGVMKDLGIVFGCFDFIVTPDNEYVFLEVNEMGAFLWIEEQNPDFLLVDAFCEFLRQGRPDFALTSGKDSVRLADLRAAALRRMEEAATAHVLEPRSAQRLSSSG